ncbi:hypothetical protein ACIQ9Q_30720 [Streptomyces sp. NPDC094438]|uniref:hypothetical protein n=1 Tax=Streptomyces sp. NPDC094438 TaxID=3366061 RepID=UPI0037F40B91
MEQTILAPPMPSGHVPSSAPYWPASDTPIYDAVERDWLAADREVPQRRRVVAPPGDWTWRDIGDLFLRG